MLINEKSLCLLASVAIYVHRHIKSKGYSENENFTLYIKKIEFQVAPKKVL